jgi:hypothetical protein
MKGFEYLHRQSLRRARDFCWEQCNVYFSPCPVLSIEWGRMYCTICGSRS